MTLFNSTGFEIEDKVFVVLEGKKYHGKVIKVDPRLDRIKVDFSADRECEVSQWFHKSFWEKVNN